MNLELDRFHVDLPYPSVNRVTPDQKLIKILMEPYSGESSELTTVLQYAYHSLCCKRQYGEVSETMRGIFYVETMHLEFIGDVLCKLGANPHYLLCLRQKHVAWQSDLVCYEMRPDQMLRADIEGEKFAASFYEQTAETVEQSDISHLLARLALDEQLHVRMLSDLYGRTFKRR